MLQSLRIQNIALIPEVEIEFGEGLNVITGETGAGKSIIIGSFNFVLGEKLNKNVIRQGANFARVDAVFTAPGEERDKITKISGVEFTDNTIILSRTLKIDGKGESRINGTIVTADNLRGCAAVLINIHGQHETEVLLKPKNHVIILDGFGGQRINAVKSEYLQEYEKLQGLKKSLKTFGGNDAEHKRLVDMYKYQINEIENANLKDNEDVILSDKKSQMQNFEKIAEGLGRVLNSFSKEGGINDIFRQMSQSLSSVSHLDKRLEKIYEHTKALQYDIDEVEGDVQNYFDNLEFDENEFKRVDERLDEIKILKRKYGASVADIFAFLNETHKSLDFLNRSEEDIEKIRCEIEVQEKQVISSKNRLNEARIQVAGSLQEKMVEQLKDLGMPNCQFEVRNNPARGGEIADISTPLEGTESGARESVSLLPDEIEFLFTANSGEPVRPLVHIISGGEMSRFMLALKAVTANIEGVGTLVFDEIDSGISGIMGHKIADKMEVICKFHQIIAVTHLAQIASRSNHHYLIKKNESDGKTITTVQKLDNTQHDEELTRMVGGADFISKMNKSED